MGTPRLDKPALLDQLLCAIGFYPTLQLETDSEGLIWVLDGKDKIAIVNPSRMSRYRHGVRRKCRQLARRRYLGNGKVTILPGDTVMNIGANIGEAARHFADCGAQVIAFEPDPTARHCLIANTKGTTVEVLSKGVWKEDGQLNFYLSTETADSSAINPSGESITIDAVTLDSVVSERKLDSIRLIAGDAEGAEPEVLLGAKYALTITDFVSLDCSYERRGEQTRDACTELLTSAGFVILNSNSRKHILAKRA